MGVTRDSTSEGPTAQGESGNCCQRTSGLIDCNGVTASKIDLGSRAPAPELIKANRGALEGGDFNSASRE